jgi:diketogulonate reductase-like aldo/keto reductase
MSNSPLLTLNNGVRMPALGLGVYQASADETLTAVHSALQQGYRLIDTAAAYGNEAQVGEAICSGGIERADVFVTTKLWISDYGFDGALHAFDRSMRKLGLDYLDLYLLHWPTPSAFHSTVASYKAAERLLREGRVRAIGVCNFSPTHLQKLAAATDVVPTVNQVELHPFFAQKVLTAEDARLGIITQAWSPLSGVQRYSKQGAADPLVHPVVMALAAKHQKTPAQIILRWHLEHGFCAIPKSVRPHRIAENFAVFDFSLSTEDMANIDALDTGVRGGPDPEQVNPGTFDFKIKD